MNYNLISKRNKSSVLPHNVGLIFNYQPEIKMYRNYDA